MPYKLMARYRANGQYRNNADQPPWGVEYHIEDDEACAQARRFSREVPWAWFWLERED